MPVFGQHESGQRIHLSGVGAIYLLKQDDKKILKVLQPPEGIWTEEQMREEMEAFTSHAKVQKTLGQASQAWAPVHEIAAIRAGTEGSSGGGEATQGAAGNDISGAYLVMDRYERTVQSLIDGRVNLNNSDLRAIISGILKGLRDIRQVATRPHGNLKPSNVLLAKSADLTQATVHLSDPAADSALTPKSDNKDFADLAAILYELANHRPYQGGTIPRTKDWNDLGPNGEDWRKLCNTLVDIGSGGGTPDERNIDKMLAAIDTWRAKPKGSKLPLLAVAAVLFLVIAGAVTWFLMRDPPIDFNQAHWEKFCLEYHAWFGQFSDMSPAEKDRISGPGAPVGLRKLLDDPKIAEHRPNIVTRTATRLEVIAADPPETARKGRGPNKTRDALMFIDQVRGTLAPDKWPALGTLDKTAVEYERRGWGKPAAGIRNLVQAARPPEIPATPDIKSRLENTPKVDMVGRISDTVRVSGTVAEIEKRWASIQDLIKTLPKTEVPLLNAFPRFAEELPRSQASGPADGTLADVVALSNAFAEIEKIATQLSTELNRKDPAILFPELAKDPGAQLPADGKLTVSTYATLAALSKDYVQLKEDPRTAVAWSQSLEEIQKNLIDPIKEANPQDPNLKSLVDRKAKIQEHVEFFSKKPAIAKERTRLLTLVGSARDDLSKLKTDGETWVAPYIIDPPKYIAQQRALLANSPLAGATSVVQAQWQKAHEALLGKVEAAPQELKKYRTFQAVDARFKSLQTIYAAFDKRIPATIAGLSDIPAKPEWKAAIAARVATTYREQALTDLMTNPSLKWADDLPQVADPAYESFATSRANDFKQLCADALALLADFDGIQSQLDKLDLHPTDIDKNAKTWRDLLAKWKDRKHPLLADAAITDAVKPITDRTAALIALDGASDYKALAAAAVSPAPEIALTAWRKLADVAVVESVPVLDDEEKSQAHLSALLAKSVTVEKPRAAAITTEMQAQRPVRWHRYAAVLKSAAAIQDALDRRAAFHVTLSAESHPELTYDDYLYTLYKAFQKKPAEAELKTVARDFITRVLALPASASKEKIVQDLIARMEKPLAPGAGEVSAAGAGPKLAGWEQETPNPSVRLYYFPAKNNARHVLEFTKIEAAQKTVFLCTSEVSFDLFAEVAGPRAADLNNARKPERQRHWFTENEQTWSGPRVWQLSDGKFALNDKWIFLEPIWQDVDIYPAGAAPEKPAATFPMQNLSPWAAMYIASALGCRLPTSEEWKSAVDKFETKGPKDAWNLRGAAFLAQKQHLAQFRKPIAKFPDDGIFLPGVMLYDSKVKGAAATAWACQELAKTLPGRVGSSAVYPTSQLWFRKTASQPGAGPPGSGIPHDLIGNVAEYVFDAPTANAVIKEAKASIPEIDAAVAAGAKHMGVIGGSSLSPPQIPIFTKQRVDMQSVQTESGFADVGFRLAYTAPIDSIADVLQDVFNNPPYLAMK